MNYRISDAVAMRMIQIFQEAVLFGLDGADLMRQVRLINDPVEEGTMTLDPDYVKQVEEMHQKYLDGLEEKKNSNDQKSDLIFS